VPSNKKAASDQHWGHRREWGNHWSILWL